MTYKNIGKYKFDPNNWLGSGSFATVYKGFNTETNQVVAIKEIDIQRLNRSRDFEQIQRNLISEICIMKKMNHQHILKLEDVINDDHYIYIILEYCGDGDLLSYMKKHSKTTHTVTGLTEYTTHRFAVQMMEALKYMHMHGIVHRDLKPQNILLSQGVDNQLTIKIADFGFAKVLAPLQIAETICGSPLYMAPEILNSKKYTDTADLWSFGVILYQMLVGDTPFQASSILELVNMQKKTSHLAIPLNTIVSKECGNLISSLLYVDPNKRISWQTFFKHPWFLHPVTKMSGSVPNGIVSGVSTETPVNEQTAPTILHHSLPIDTMDLLKSFEIIDAPHEAIWSDKFAYDKLSEFQIHSDLGHWLEIMKTLNNVGDYKIDLSYIGEGIIFYEYCIKIYAHLLNMIQQSNLNLANLYEKNGDTELYMIQMSNMFGACSDNVRAFSKIQRQKTICKPPENLVYDTAMSYERQSMVEWKMDDTNKATEHIISCTYLLESLIPFTDEYNRYILTMNVSKLRKLIPLMTK